jgi:hypothetical protein
MIDNWVQVFEIIRENDTLREVVNFTIFTAKVLNGDQSLAAFDICELPKLFDVKTTEEGKPPKVLYHYILKYAFKFGQSTNLSELFKEGQLQVFSDEEMQFMRQVLRENIEGMWQRHCKLKEVNEFVQSKITETPSKFNDQLRLFVSQFEGKGRVVLEHSTTKFERAVACFIEFFMVTSRDKIDKII